LGERSPNKAWKSQGFNNYADHTLTEQFKDGILKLLGLADQGRVAFMCAERLYWRCHRRIISDYLKAKGHTITHIISREKTKQHELSSLAKLIDGELNYP